MDLPVLSAADVEAALTPSAAVQAIRSALLSGVDPAREPARSVLAVGDGQLLLMPSSAALAAGVKVATVAPENPARGLPRIHAVYLLFDPQTLAPTAVLDGAALTTLRTPAVSVAAVLPALLRPDPHLTDRPLRVVVFGAGPQAIGHLRTVSDALAGRRPVAPATIVVRSAERAAALLRQIPSARIMESRDPELAAALRAAELVVCATTARVPLFDSALLSSTCAVVAVGSHEPEAREVDSALAGRAQVVVEDPATALREAGDIIQAVADGHLSPAALVPLRDVVTGAVLIADDRPLLFKSTGMAWQDLAVAHAVMATWRAR